MKTTTISLALLILCCGLVASAVNHDASLVDQYDNNNGLDQQAQNYVDEQGNPVDANGNPVDANGNPVNDVDAHTENVQNSLDNLVTMLTSDQKRQMLKRIALKMKTLFFHTADSERGYITKIMEYMNDITYVENQPLIEEILKAWYTVMETGENRDLIRQVQSLLDVINSDAHIQRTISVLHGAIESVNNDPTAPRLIDVSIRTAHKAVEMKDSLRGIVQGAFDIIRDETKMNFVMNMVESMGPIMGTLKMMVGTPDISQIGPVMMQNTSPAVNPKALFNQQSAINQKQSFGNPSLQQQAPMNQQQFNNQPSFQQQSSYNPYGAPNAALRSTSRTAQFQQPTNRRY